MFDRQQSHFFPVLRSQIAQTDEEQLGMTYKELSIIGRLRKINAAGPFSMFCKLVHLWKEVYTPKQASGNFKPDFASGRVVSRKMEKTAASIRDTSTFVSLIIPFSDALA